MKAVCSTDGSTEWVAEEWKEAYERHGRSLLGLEPQARERMRSSPEVTVAAVHFAPSTKPASSAPSASAGLSSSNLSRQKSSNTLRGLLSAGQSAFSGTSPSGKSWR